MSEKKKKKDLELKSQVLNDFLLLRRDAIKSLYDGRPWDALERLETITYGLPLADFDNYVRLDEILKKKNKIIREANKIKSSSSDATIYDREKFKNKEAKKLINTIMRETTKILFEEGYFSFLRENAYGPSFEDVEQDKDVKMVEI